MLPCGVLVLVAHHAEQVGGRGAKLQLGGRDRGRPVCRRPLVGNRAHLPAHSLPLLRSHAASERGGGIGQLGECRHERGRRLVARVDDRGGESNERERRVGEQPHVRSAAVGALDVRAVAAAQRCEAHDVAGGDARRREPGEPVVHGLREGERGVGVVGTAALESLGGAAERGGHAAERGADRLAEHWQRVWREQEQADEERAAAADQRVDQTLAGHAACA